MRTLKEEVIARKYKLQMCFVINNVAIAWVGTPEELHRKVTTELSAEELMIVFPRITDTISPLWFSQNAPPTGRPDFKWRPALLKDDEEALLGFVLDFPGKSIEEGDLLLISLDNSAIALVRATTVGEEVLVLTLEPDESPDAVAVNPLLN